MRRNWGIVSWGKGEKGWAGSSLLRALQRVPKGLCVIPVTPHEGEVRLESGCRVSPTCPGPGKVMLRL